MIAVYIIAGLLILFFVVAAILPGRYKIEKAITINRPAAQVFEKVANLNNYKDWNPWQKMEPDNNAKITGTPATPGHKFSWDGKKIGAGSLTVRSVIAPASVQLDLEFIRPFASRADDQWKFEESNGSTKVTWTNEGDLPYPMGRIMGAMIKKNLNTQFEQGLRNMKQSCES